MKRDMDLLRQVLLAVEGSPEPFLMRTPVIAGYDAAEVVEHVRLAADAGYITASDASSYDGPAYLNLRMTWSGHEFLDSTRDPEIWDKTKATAAKVGSFSVPFLIELASGFMKAKAQTLGLPMM